MSGNSNMRYMRVDDELWDAALDRATAEGGTVSGLVRQWLEDYVNDGQVQANGRRRPKVRVSAAERTAAREAVDALDIVAVVVDAINAKR